MNAGGVWTDKAKRVIEIKLVSDLADVPINKEEAYRLKVNSKILFVEAITEQGIYWVLQTLKQLATYSSAGITIPGCIFVDWPAFRIRGFMQDVGRSYIPMEELKREISKLSAFKINVFHWHLTEN